VRTRMQPGGRDGAIGLDGESTSELNDSEAQP
jgi:hypothetical protein